MWLYWLAFALLFYTAVYVGVLYLTDIFFVLLCESEGVTWFALNEMKTTRKVRSLAAHRKKEKENRNGTFACTQSI